MSASQQGPRAVDHLVLPTVGLEVARQRLSALGFTVAPVGVHPFGTSNCCVFLADGAYLEPLAVNDAAATAAAIDAGNAFVARDALFRQKAGQEGLSAVVFSTDDAAADHRRFLSSGLSAGPMLDFSRAFVDPEGRSAVAAFRLAFASQSGSDAAFAFACQRVNPPPADRSALETHENGVFALDSVIGVSDDPAASAAFLADVAQATHSPGQVTDTPRHPGTAAERSEAGVSRNHSVTVNLRNAAIDIVDAETYLTSYGRPAPSGTGLRFAAIRFRVRDIRAANAALAGCGIPFSSIGADILVAAAPGQGVDFLFGEDH